MVATTTEVQTPCDALVSIRRVAQLYDVNERTIERWEGAGRIPRAVVSRHRFKRWSLNDIRADIERIKRGEAEEAAS